jgi:DNA-3-methyladenine glycosylase
MFSEGGHLYVYFTYGMHYCCNVVTEREGRGMAVLIRAGEPIEGLSRMIRRRGTSDPLMLCSGPARLCQALGIGRKENGTDLCGDRIWLSEGGDAKTLAKRGRVMGAAGGFRAAHRQRLAGSPTEVLRLDRSTRIGIRDGMDYRWRFYIRGNRFVSRTRPATGVSGLQNDRTRPKHGR